MHNVKKNQIVVVLLVVMIVVAGYLNYRTDDDGAMAWSDEDSVHSTQQFSSEVEGADTEEDVTAEGVLLPEEAEIAETAEDEVDQIQEETGEKTGEETIVETQGETEEARMPGEAIMVESDAVVPEYFAEAKVERENARAKSQDMLYELMAQEDTPDEEKSEAAKKILELQSELKTKRQRKR